MRLTLVAVAVLGLGILGYQEAQQNPCDSHSATRCASIEHDAHGFKACACAAGKGEAKYCSPEGKRISETMEGCVNPDYCMKKCCRCCPKD